MFIQHHSASFACHLLGLNPTIQFTLLLDSYCDLLGVHRLLHMIMYAHVSSALTEISGVQRGRVTASPCTHCIDEPRDSHDSRKSRDLHDLHESRLSHLLDLSAQICWIFSQKGPQLLLCLVISHSPGIVNKDPRGKALDG